MNTVQKAMAKGGPITLSHKFAQPVWKLRPGDAHHRHAAENGAYHQ
jgi:hypothetical protein